MRPDPSSVPPPEVYLTPAAQVVSMIVDDFRATIDASDLNWLLRTALKKVAPLLARWALELAVIQFAPTLLPVLELLLPYLEKVLQPAILTRVRLLSAVVRMQPADFHPAVRKSMGTRLASRLATPLPRQAVFQIDPPPFPLEGP